MAEPLTVERLEEEVWHSRRFWAWRGDAAAITAAVWPLIRDAIDAERLAATRDAIRYVLYDRASPWYDAPRGGALDDLAHIRASEVCPLCDTYDCEPACPLRPIRHQEPTADQDIRPATCGIAWSLLLPGDSHVHVCGQPAGHRAAGLPLHACNACTFTWSAASEQAAIDQLIGKADPLS